MKVLFSGGGTMGPVIPLLAVAEEIKNQNPNTDFYWIGTSSGPEQKVVRGYNIEFHSIPSGKLRRYFSLYNLTDIFKIMAGFIKALILIKKTKPNVIVSAGGFVAVPVIWAGWFLGVRSIIHQQDIQIGLANKLCFKPASLITTCFEDTTKKIKSKKVRTIGNPVRNKIKNNYEFDLDKTLKKYNLKNNLPTVLVTTGGRGAKAINNLVKKNAGEITKFCQIIHITGKGKKIESNNPNYHTHEFIIDTTEVLKIADLVIARAGMGTLTELAYLKKPSIIIPIPHSHQELNARYFVNKEAIEYLDQDSLEEKIFIKKIKDLLEKKRKASTLGNNMHQAMRWGAEIDLAKIILHI